MSTADPQAKALGAKCSECPLVDRPFVRPPPRRALLALVGERPDKYELEHGRYFAGPTGELMDERILPYAGLTRKDLSLHNAVCCTIERKLSPAEWKQAIACCAPRLALDLKASRPTALLAAGKRALQALTGRAQITAWTGAPLKGWAFRHRQKETKKGRRVELVECPPKDALADFTKYTLIPAMHPAWHFRGNNIDYLPMNRIHFGRALALAKGELPEWKWPQIEIEPDERSLRLLERLRRAGRKGARISFDVETLGDNPFGDALSVLGVGHREIGAVALTWDSYDAGKWGFQMGVLEAKPGTVAARCRCALLAILADPKIEKVAQNGQYDLMCLRHRGIAFNGKWRTPKKGVPKNGLYYDTMKAHAVYAPAIQHNLALICSIEFSAPRWKDDFQAGSGEVKGKAKFQKADPKRLKPYNGKDNIMQSHVEGRAEKRLLEVHRGRELFDGYTRRAPIADEMTWRGVKVDRERRSFHHHALRTRMGMAAKDLELIAARMRMPLRTHHDKALGKDYQAHFNPDSNADWRKLFFGKFHVKPTRYSETTGEPSLDEESLAPLVTHPNALVQAAARAGLLYRRWGTLDRNHVRGLRLDSRSIVHPFWKPTGTIGQRWSGSRPNPQNIPKPVEERLPSGKRIIVHGGLRDMFVPHAERGWIVEADYKAIEYRIAAFLSNDIPTLEMFDAFDSGHGPDPHTVNAITLFGIKGRDPSKKERTLAKNFIYGGILYGGEINTIHAVLSVDTPIEVTLVEHMVGMYHARHSALGKWHRQLVRDANRNGYVEEPISGRRRHFWASRIKPTEVYNYPVQTLAGWLINLAIEKVAAELKWGLEGISFQVHDSLVLDGPDPLRLAEILQAGMDYTLNWEGRKMRFPVDIAVGGMTRDKETERLSFCGRSAWAPSTEMSLDEIAKLPKGKERLAT